MEDSVVRHSGCCEITLLFKGYNEGLKESVLSVLTEGYQARMSENNEQQETDGFSDNQTL